MPSNLVVSTTLEPMGHVFNMNRGAKWDVSVAGVHDYTDRQHWIGCVDKQTSQDGLPCWIAAIGFIHRSRPRILGEFDCLAIAKWAVEQEWSKA